MTNLPKAYEAKTVDAKWYQFWQESEFFKANPLSSKKPYCIVMPPPNVTGALHMGHALVNTLQDVLIRWKRMSGFEALWVPGTDHAGIATQTVVESHLKKLTGKRRKEFDREEFLGHIWKWKEENQHRIINQLKALGCSCDWSRERFTMDEGNNKAVRVAFKRLYDEGLIYRGDRLVNWDPVTQTTLSDDEVEYEERNSFMWHFKYPLSDGSGYIHIATTRPETMLGDTAIAVSPKDARYSHVIGKKVRLPLMERDIPIIEDHHVDPAFGTGAVKITPAHDPNDYQMGMTHKLPFINIMTPDGKINENGGTFAGMTLAAAREAVVAEMQKQGFLEKIEPHVNRVGVSYRSKAVIEPYLSKQWFISMDGFAIKLRDAVTSGKVKLIPKNWENTYFHWINNLRDWCISRQLWWGHRIPIWHSLKDPTIQICYEGEGVPPEVAAAPEDWRQDDDVLDTWFSSALWPFSTLGWPEKTPELNRFYPNSVLVTGYDILFFWVARMLLMGEHMMGELPFPETFLHGLVYAKSYWRDLEGGGIAYVPQEERNIYELGKPVPKEVKFRYEKMSKTKGNIIDPLEIIDSYGTDAIRMALCASASQAREIDLDLRRFEEFKNFTNKVWNGARFVMMNLEGDEKQGSTPLTAEEFSQGLTENLLALEDRWILSVLNRTIASVNTKLNDYFFDQATLEAYDFFWKEFCAYYVEIAKPTLFGKIGTPEERKNKQKLLVIILLHAIRLIHPMAPFITEELFQSLKERLNGLVVEINTGQTLDPYTTEAITALNSVACIVAPYPQVIHSNFSNSKIDTTFAFMESIVYTIRNIKGEVKIPSTTAVEVHIIIPDDHPHKQTIAQNLHIISALVRISYIQLHATDPAELEHTSASVGSVEGLKVMVPIPAELLQQETARLAKEKEKLTLLIEKLSGQLANESFVSNAPPELIDKQRTLLSQAKEDLQHILHKEM
ncbi:MAG: valine--tRNA ligase [Parachlamydiaceae bacterium]|nr:valine--tRNA ligase [Parachlamydiaceae bacterium]